MSRGVPSGRKGISSIGHDAGDDTLVAVTASHLIAHGDLTLLSDIDTDTLVDARAQLIAVFTGEHLDIDHDTALAVWHFQRGISDFSRLFPKDGAQQPFFGSQVSLTLGGDLTNQNVAGVDFCAHPNDAPFVQVTQGVLAHVGDVSGDLLGPQLGVTGFHVIFFNMDRGEHVLLHDAFAEQNGVLIVVTFPGHEAHQNVPTQGDLAVVSGWAVCQGLPLLELLPHVHNGTLVDTGAVVGAEELDELIGLGNAAVILHADGVGADTGDHAIFLSQHAHFGVLTVLVLLASSHDGRFGDQQRHSLTLHICAHQGTVCVIVFQEGDHSRCHRDHHLGETRPYSPPWNGLRP